MNRKSLSLLGWPAIFWFLAFLLGPVLFILCTSFATRGTYGGIEWTFTFSNYARVFSPINAQILWRSFQISFLTTFFCLILGYPAAWAISSSSRKHRGLLIFLIAIPFLMNQIIRIYGIRLITGHDGLLVQFLNVLRIPNDPYAFSQNQILVLYGMITAYLPFMIFPLFAALEKFDDSLLEAHLDLGGSNWNALWKVLIPNTREAIANGCILVFVPAMGEFVIPDLLGGAKNILLGNLVTEQFLKSRDWPFGAALSTILILILSLTTFCLQAIGKSRRSGK